MAIKIKGDILYKCENCKIKYRYFNNEGLDIITAINIIKNLKCKRCQNAI